MAFLKEVKRKLGLTNLTISQSRIENLRINPVPLILCRAFSSLNDLADKSQHLLAPDGIWLAMKGAYPTKEIEEVSANFIVEAVNKVVVPLLKAERHLVHFRQK